MRRFMLIVAALLFASPVLAVDVNAVKVGDDVAITYAGGTGVRAFALDVNVDNGATITGISGFYSGEGAGYGIFPGNFRDYIVPTAPNWVDVNYTPVAPVGDPGAAGAIPGAAITIELGSLYDGAPNQPPPGGNLCVLTIDAPNGDCNVCVSVNPERGNVVLEDANEAATNLPICRHISFQPEYCFPDTPEYANQYADYLLYRQYNQNPDKVDCWCEAYQCEGDADGLTQGLPKYRIYTGDFNIVVANWKKKITDPTIDPCADFDHKGQGLPKYRVYTDDFNILVGNWKAKDSDFAGNCPRPD